MNALSRILVPVDESKMSNEALAFALDLAERSGAKIVFCHAVELAGAAAAWGTPYVMPDTALLERQEDECKRVLSRASVGATAQGVANETVELAGPAVPAILDLLEKRQNIDAIVMGTHGRRGLSRAFFGSTTEGIIRQAAVPVFALPQSASTAAERPVGFSCILVALDHTDAADAALDFAIGLAEPEKTRIILANAVDILSNYDELAASQSSPLSAAATGERNTSQALLDAAAARIGARGIVETVVIEGPPSPSILELARARGADLIAIGTHGRRGIERLVLGSVAEGVLRFAPVPVLVVHRGKRAAKKKSEAVPATSEVA